jgi:hypothetical protein
MRPNFIYILIFTFFVGLFSFHSARATHMKGGEITVRRVSSTALTYEFTLTIYCENNVAWQQQREVLFALEMGWALSGLLVLMAMAWAKTLVMGQ